MNMLHKVHSICQKTDNTEKIKLLKDLILDCHNEMEAQDQNMHPEIWHHNAEAFRIAKDRLREFEEKS